MSRSVPRALPEDVVADIWKEVLPKDTDQAILDLILQNELRPNEAGMLEFVQAAMEYPHFATSTDISVAIKMDVPRVNWLMRAVREKARRNRICQPTTNAG